MIKLALKNIKLLAFFNKIPIIRYFFILKISKDFNKIKNNSVLEKFYQDIYVRNKTSKRTADKRFIDLDKLSLKYFRENELYFIHDIAVSSGITSDNFFELLEKEQIRFQLDISDKYALMHVKEDITTKVFDADKNLTFAYWYMFFAGDKNIYFPFTVLLFNIIRKNNKVFDFDYSVYLFHPNVLDKIEAKRIHVVDYDIFQADINKKYHFVRCMNILNKGYFSDDKILIALLGIKKSLKENGILLIGRTNKKGINNASFFKKQNNSFTLMQDVNSGSEIKELVLKL